MRRTSRIDRARELLRPLADDDPDALALRAQLALDRGDQEEASRLLAGSSRSHAGLARLRGLLALARRDAPAAVRELCLAYRLEPDDRQTIVSLGTALTLLGDRDAARAVQDAVGRLRTYDAIVSRLASPEAAGPVLFGQIGTAAEAIGRRSEARAWYQLAIARDPLQAEAQQGLFRLGRATTDTPPVDFKALPTLEGP